MFWPEYLGMKIEKFRIFDIFFNIVIDKIDKLTKKSFWQKTSAVHTLREKIKM